MDDESVDSEIIYNRVSSSEQKKVKFPHSTKLTKKELICYIHQLQDKIVDGTVKNGGILILEDKPTRIPKIKSSGEYITKRMFRNDENKALENIEIFSQLEDIVRK